MELTAVTRELDVLVIDDSHDDVLLIEQALRRGRVPCAVRHVQDAESFDRAVAEHVSHLHGVVADLRGRLHLEFRVLTADGAVRWVGSEGAAVRDAAGAIVCFQGIVTDITDRRRTDEQRLEALRRAQAQMESIGRLLLSPALAEGDVEALARGITEEATTVCGVARANVWLFDNAETELRCIDLYEAGTRRHTAGARLHEDQFESEFRALKAARYVDASDALTDPRTAGYVEGYLKPAGITAMIDAVVQVAGAHLGLLCLEHVGGPRHWEQDEIAYACQLADKIGLALSNRERRESERALRRAMMGTVEAIAATMESRDPYTAGHERRVADLAAAIGAEMGLDEFTVEGLHFGALIHDIGKIQIPAELLVKPTRLSEIEYELVKTHAQVGYEIVKNIDFPWPVSKMVLQHHERIDGSGYPHGARGEEIALEARILAVADVVEAMASDRPYRPGLGIDAALSEIESRRGIAFDAAAVDACLRLFREGRYTLPGT